MEQEKHNDIFESLSKDRAVRQAVTRESHLMFFSVYFPRYLKYPTAEFHKDIFRITEDQSNNLACIVAFRGSGKSTLVSMSYALWATLGIQQKKFVLIICQTQNQARQTMANIRYELETNTLLKSDLGPFQEEAGGEWAMSSIVFSNTNARITVASFDQSIRGVRHHEHRPDLIILDDIEDLNSTKTIEGRNKTFDWFTREIMPLGDVGTRVIIVGNLLHEDSLIMRLKKKIDDKESKGIYKWFPLLDDDGRCLWPGKFDTEEKIEDLRNSVANELAWQQEYLLKIISDSTRVIDPKWIQHYSDVPKDLFKKAHGTFIGVDLAISLKSSADYTAIVVGVLHGDHDKKKIYIMPNPINKRMNHPETIDTIKMVSDGLKFDYPPFVIIEANGFQEIYANQLADSGLKVIDIVNHADKRTRLALTSSYVRSGFIVFPETGCEALIAQLTGFGMENHDDLADAFSILVLHSMEKVKRINGWEAYADECKNSDGPWVIG